MGGIGIRNSSVLTRAINYAIILLTIIMFGLGSKKTVHIKIKEEEKTKLITQVNRIVGQLTAIKDEVIKDNVCDETLTQLLASRGGINKLATDLVGLGILDCLKGRKNDELTTAVQNLLKAL
jgi:DNA-binding FrmR family transcriptional regulator